MSEHTEGPLWIIGDDEHEGGLPFIEIGSGTMGHESFRPVCEVPCTVPDEGEFVLTDEDREIARRLVAAWNACRGIETETLETAEEPLATGALAAIRNLLDDGGIPRGTFADDQVRNLVALYNQNTARADAAEALLFQSALDLSEAGKLLRHSGLPGVGDIMAAAAKRNLDFIDAKADARAAPLVTPGDEGE